MAAERTYLGKFHKTWYVILCETETILFSFRDPFNQASRNFILGSKPDPISQWPSKIVQVIYSA